jgi:hypothetical protein
VLVEESNNFLGGPVNGRVVYIIEVSGEINLTVGIFNGEPLVDSAVPLDGEFIS